MKLTIKSEGRGAKKRERCFAVYSEKYSLCADETILVFSVEQAEELRIWLEKKLLGFSVKKEIPE